MTRFHSCTSMLVFWSFSFAVILLAGCVSLPAVVFGAERVVITDVRELAGRWEGRVANSTNPVIWDITVTRTGPTVPEAGRVPSRSPTVSFDGPIPLEVVDEWKFYSSLRTSSAAWFSLVMARTPLPGLSILDSHNPRMFVTRLCPTGMASQAVVRASGTSRSAFRSELISGTNGPRAPS